MSNCSAISIKRHRKYENRRQDLEQDYSWMPVVSSIRVGCVDFISMAGKGWWWGGGWGERERRMSREGESRHLQCNLWPEGTEPEPEPKGGQPPTVPGSLLKGRKARPADGSKVCHMLGRNEKIYMSLLCVRYSFKNSLGNSYGLSLSLTKHFTGKQC